MTVIKDLIEQYPEPFSTAYWCDLPPGWEWILEAFVKSLDTWRWHDENDKMVSALTYTRIAQYKEKFGTLRLYAHVSEDCPDGLVSEISGKIQGAATMAEYLSERTCAECGVMNDTVKNTAPNGWYLTTCEKCRTTSTDE